MQVPCKCAPIIPATVILLSLSSTVGAAGQLHQELKQDEVQAAAETASLHMMQAAASSAASGSACWKLQVGGPGSKCHVLRLGAPEHRAHAGCL